MSLTFVQKVKVTHATVDFNQLYKQVQVSAFLIGYQGLANSYGYVQCGIEDRIKALEIRCDTLAHGLTNALIRLAEYEGTPTK